MILKISQELPHFTGLSTSFQELVMKPRRKIHLAKQCIAFFFQVTLKMMHLTQ